MTSRLDDLYSRLDSQTQEGLVREGRTSSVTTNTGGTTTTFKPTAATTTAPTAQEVSTAQYIQDASRSGTDLTQAANRLSTSGAGGSGGPTLTMEEAIRLQDEAAAKRAAAIQANNQRIDPVTGGVLGGGSRPTPTPTTDTGSGVTPPAAPTGPEAPTAEVAEGNFGQFTEAEIDAALRGIEAEFGMTREQLLADKSMIGAQYRLLMAQMTRARQQAVQGATSDAVGRGIYRSGILGENIANIEQQFGEQEAGTRQQQLIQEQALERQLAFLDQGQAAAGAQAQNNILGQAAATMTQAGVNPTQAGFGQGAVQMPGLPGQGAPAGAAQPGAFGAGNIGGVIPRTPLGPGDISGQAPPAATNPYANYPVVGGYYIDPNTGMAVARVDGR